MGEAEFSLQFLNFVPGRKPPLFIAYRAHADVRFERSQLRTMAPCTPSHELPLKRIVGSDDPATTSVWDDGPSMIESACSHTALSGVHPAKKNCGSLRRTLPVP